MWRTCAHGITASNLVELNVSKYFILNKYVLQAEVLPLITLNIFMCRVMEFSFLSEAGALGIFSPSGGLKSERESHGKLYPVSSP